MPTLRNPRARSPGEGAPLLWEAVEAYERCYAEHPPRLHVPRIRVSHNLTRCAQRELKSHHHAPSAFRARRVPSLRVRRLTARISLVRSEFERLFHRPAQPVLIPFRSLRRLGFRTQALSLDALAALYPSPTADEVQQHEHYLKGGRTAAARRGHAANASTRQLHMNLGGAIARIRGGARVKRGTVLFPRNLAVRHHQVPELHLQEPPLITGKHGMSERTMLPPRLWFGTQPVHTEFHHDCCDNFVTQLVGSKRFTLAPPTDWRLLVPEKSTWPVV